MAAIREYHLFAGIGGGIYGGKLLGNKCVGAVEIMPYARNVLAQRKKDGWMDKTMDIDSHTDITQLDGHDITGSFDVLCGGFPCQAFSTAAHGKNIAAKNLWDHMFRIVKESAAPIVFGENVVLRAIEKAKSDLESVGYKVERIRLGNSDIGADHQRNRFWLLAVKDKEVFAKVAKKISSLPKLTGGYWTQEPPKVAEEDVDVDSRRMQLLGIGNAQSPFVAATAFRILVNRHLAEVSRSSEIVSSEELSRVFEKRGTWIQKEFNNIGLVHTPTTMANYACPSMMKHQGCRNFVTVFGRPQPQNAEYLMGFPVGASSPKPQKKNALERWK